MMLTKRVKQLIDNEEDTDPLKKQKMKFIKAWLPGLKKETEQVKIFLWGRENEKQS